MAVIKMEKTTMVKMEKKTFLKMLKKVLEKNLMIAYLDLQDYV